MVYFHLYALPFGIINDWTVDRSTSPIIYIAFCNH